MNQRQIRYIGAGMWWVLVGSACSSKSGFDGPSARRDAMGVFDGSGSVFQLVGGWNQDGVKDDGWALDIPHREWVPVEGSDTPLMGGDAVLSGDAAFVFGGALADGTTTDGLREWELYGGVWEDADPGTSRPAARRGHNLVRLADDAAVLLGGYDSATVFSDVWTLDPTVPAWTAREVSGGPGPLTLAPAAAADGVIWVHGGMDETGELQGTLWALDIASWTWTAVSDEGPTPRAEHLVAAKNGRVVVWGGDPSDGDLWVYDTNSGEWSQGEVDNGPEPRAGFAWDVTLDGQWLLMFGGETATDWPNDVWVLNLDSFVWSQLLRLDGEPL